MDKLQISPIGKVSESDIGMFIQIDGKYVDALKGLDGFSHLQVVWWFSECDKKSMRQVLEMPKPYMNGPNQMGVFATRSPIRPNPIALSSAEVIDIDYNNGLIQVAWIDANDGTPILDIKPYTPSSDRIKNPRVPMWCRHWPASYEDSGNFDWENEFNF